MQHTCQTVEKVEEMIWELLTYYICIQSRLSSKWFSFVWTTQWIIWRHCLRTMKKMFNVSGSLYMMPTKTSMLCASAD